MVSVSRPAAAVFYLAAVTAGTAVNQDGPELNFRQHEHQPPASPMLPPFLEGQPERWQVRPERTAPWCCCRSVELAYYCRYRTPLRQQSQKCLESNASFLLQNLRATQPRVVGVYACASPYVLPASVFVRGVDLFETGVL